MFHLILTNLQAQNNNKTMIDSKVRLENKN